MEREDSKESVAGVAEEVPSTKNPAMVPLAEDQTVMQIDCGTFHTG